MNIQKLSGTFVNPGDVITLTKPMNASQVALRLYEKTLEIALFIIPDAQGIPAQQDPHTTVELPRFFLASPTTDPLPLNFVKYIGVLGLPVNGSVVEVYIIEVSGIM